MAEREVILAHWKDGDEVEERLQRLRKAGLAPLWGGMDGSGVARLVRSRQPKAVVIDLGRLPSHGRELGMFLRQSPNSRHIPLVFVDGAEPKVKRVRDTLPDATFCSWRGVKGAVARAVRTVPAEPVVPPSDSGFNTGVPLAQKRGLKAEMTVALVSAPLAVDATLGELPAGIKLRRRAQGQVDLAIWFVQRAADLERQIDTRAEWIGDGTLWIAWPKKASELPTDLTQSAVRATGLAHGLVDSKICAIDADWSALRFTRRRRR